MSCDSKCEVHTRHDLFPPTRRRIYGKHPDVKFVPGPFYMGDGWLGLACNTICITWTLFISVLFSLPTYFPVTKDNMNYASVITVAVIASSLCVPLFPRDFSSHAHNYLMLKTGFGISPGTFLNNSGNRSHRLMGFAVQGHTTGDQSHTQEDLKNPPTNLPKTIPTNPTRKAPM